MSDVVLAKAFSSNLNWKILELLVNGELEESDITRTLEAPPNVVKSHLSNLVGAGLLIVHEKVSPSGARLVLYGPTENSRSLGYPPRGYQLLCEAFVKSLVESMGQDGARVILRDIGVRIGEDIGRNLISMAGSTSWDPQMYADLFVKKFLASAGTYPAVRRLAESELEYQQSNCLFQELADKMPGLICDTMDEGVHEGIDNILGVKTTRLACKGHSDPTCTFSVSWRTARSNSQTFVRGH